MGRGTWFGPATGLLAIAASLSLLTGCVEIDYQDGFCPSWCLAMDDRCAPSQRDPRVGGTRAACVSICEERTSDDPRWLGNYICANATCDFDVCFEGSTAAPLPTAPFCTSACERLESCALLDQLNLPTDDLESCLGACTGSTQARPEIADVVTCLDRTLAEGCDAAALTNCEGRRDAAGCGRICGNFLAANQRETCADDAAIRQTFPTWRACHDACWSQSAGDPARETFFTGCLVGSQCDDARACLQPPPQPEPACRQTCDDLVEGLCGALPLGLATQDECAMLCTGVLAGSGFEAVTPDLAAACVGEQPRCPTGGSDLLRTLAGCASRLSPPCDEICGALDTCDVVSRSFCRGECFVLELEDREALEALTRCARGNENCDAVQDCVSR